MKTIFLILALFAIALAQIECPTQRDALVAIYDATGGIGWTTQDNWLSDMSICTWAGITCNGNDDVVGIDLSGYGLTGQLPDEIGCFHFLMSLLLNDNLMTSTIPEDICMNMHIKYIQMDRAGIAEGIPECICTMEFVQYFYMDDNALTGPIPTCVSDMTYLREFHARCNQLTGSVPLEFLDLMFLEELRVNCNDDLTCPPEFDDASFIFVCGDIDCDQCPLDPISCPETIEIPDCGTYIRQV
eukprot:gnl/Dysnectes_brevis/1510_a1711_2081.p1 GENE.gnl/Dysnectes_brevis/1510_a1711_2081~~gnl/Dysnectes_brevis/1510_a1711_2081.p1  ORF type:complete len:243 (+),score=112.70 gnl/Dysnectes_brevis/1510_a1711_2081:757-1485(+)